MIKLNKKPKITSSSVVAKSSVFESKSSHPRLKSKSERLKGPSRVWVQTYSEWIYKSLCLRINESKPPKSKSESLSHAQVTESLRFTSLDLTLSLKHVNDTNWRFLCVFWERQFVSFLLYCIPCCCLKVTCHRHLCISFCSLPSCRAFESVTLSFSPQRISFKVANSKFTVRLRSLWLALFDNIFSNDHTIFDVSLISFQGTLWW